MNGKIIRIEGSVVDIAFEDGLPKIREALTVETPSGKKDMEEVVDKAKDTLGMYDRKTILFHIKRQ